MPFCCLLPAPASICSVITPTAPKSSLLPSTSLPQTRRRPDAIRRARTQAQFRTRFQPDVADRRLVGDWAGDGLFGVDRDCRGGQIHRRQRRILFAAAGHLHRDWRHGRVRRLSDSDQGLAAGGAVSVSGGPAAAVGGADPRHRARSERQPALDSARLCQPAAVRADEVSGRTLCRRLHHAQGRLHARFQEGLSADGRRDDAGRRPAAARTGLWCLCCHHFHRHGHPVPGRTELESVCRTGGGAADRICAADPDFTVPLCSVCSDSWIRLPIPTARAISYRTL